MQAIYKSESLQWKWSWKKYIHGKKCWKRLKRIQLFNFMHLARGFSMINSHWFVFRNLNSHQTSNCAFFTAQLSKHTTESPHWKLNNNKNWSWMNMNTEHYLFSLWNLSIRKKKNIICEKSFYLWNRWIFVNKLTDEIEKKISI